MNKFTYNSAFYLSKLKIHIKYFLLKNNFAVNCDFVGKEKVFPQYLKIYVQSHSLIFGTVYL